MAFLIGSFNAILGIDSSGYRRGIIESNALTQVFGSTFATFVTNPLLGGAQLFGNLARGAISSAKEILATAEAVDRLSQQTGIAASTIEALRAKFRQAGFAEAQADLNLIQFTRRLGEVESKGGEAAAAFDRFNISLEGVGSTDEALNRTLDAIDNLETATERTDAAMQLFSARGGSQLINAVGGGSEALQELVEFMGRLGLVTRDDGVAALAALNTQVGVLQQGIEGVKRTAIAEFLIGIASELTGTEDVVANIAGELIDRIAPVSRDIGQTVGGILNDVKEILEDVERTSNIIDGLFTGVAIASDSLVGSPRAINTIRHIERLNQQAGTTSIDDSLGVPIPGVNSASPRIAR